MLIDETGIEGYRSFVRAVIDAKDGSALWHCYVGRDRCGMGSALVETMLGVSRDDILNDYLATNLYAPSSSRWTPRLALLFRSRRAGTRTTWELYGLPHGHPGHHGGRDSCVPRAASRTVIHLHRAARRRYPDRARHFSGRASPNGISPNHAFPLLRLLR